MFVAAELPRHHADADATPPAAVAAPPRCIIRYVAQSAAALL